MAVIATEVLSGDFPQIFESFQTLVGEQHWFKRARAIELDIKGKPLLKDFLLAENRVAFALRALTEHHRKWGRIPDVRIRVEVDYDVYALVVQFMTLHDALPREQARALVGRLRGSFGNPDDLRGLQFEWLVATQLVKRGFTVDFPAASDGTYDFVALHGSQLIDVECKSVSPNKGRAIHHRDALELYSLLQQETRIFSRQMNGGLLVRVTVPKRIPKSHTERKMLCDRIYRAMLTHHGLVDADLEVSLHDFDPLSSPLLPYPPDIEKVRAFFKASFGIDNRELAVTYSKGGKALVFSFESKCPDRHLEAMIETAKDAADRQLSGQRPGIVCLKFEGITGEELVSIADEHGSPSPLRYATSELLNSRQGSHLVCVSYFADGPLVHHADGGIAREGRTYFFENKTSPHYSEVVATAFRELGRDSSKPE